MNKRTLMGATLPLLAADSGSSGGGIMSRLGGTRAKPTIGKAANDIRMVPIDMVVPRPEWNIRLPLSGAEAEHEASDLFALSEDIEQNGIKKPIPVNPPNADGKLTCNGGHRRMQAIDLIRARGGKLPKEIPVKIADRELSEGEQVLEAMSDNSGKALKPLERAMAFRRILDDPNTDLSMRDLAKGYGLSAMTVSDDLKLLEMPADMIAAVTKGLLTAKAALTIYKSCGNLGGAVIEAAQEIMAEEKIDGLIGPSVYQRTAAWVQCTTTAHDTNEGEGDAYLVGIMNRDGATTGNTELTVNADQPSAGTTSSGAQTGAETPAPTGKTKKGRKSKKAKAAGAAPTAPKMPKVKGDLPPIPDWDMPKIINGILNNAAICIDLSSQLGHSKAGNEARSNFWTYYRAAKVRLLNEPDPYGPKVTEVRTNTPEGSPEGQEGANEGAPKEQEISRGALQ